MRGKGGEKKKKGADAPASFRFGTLRDPASVTKASRKEEKEGEKEKERIEGLPAALFYLSTKSILFFCTRKRGKEKRGGGGSG